MTNRAISVRGGAPGREAGGFSRLPVSITDANGGVLKGTPPYSSLAAGIRAAHASADAEYARLEVVPIADLPTFLAGVAPHLTPQAPVFLSRMGLLSEW